LLCHISIVSRGPKEKVEASPQKPPIISVGVTLTPVKLDGDDSLVDKCCTLEDGRELEGRFEAGGLVELVV
jgi:hypothetical protein